MSERTDKDERTLWVGNLNKKVSKKLLYELFIQVKLIFIN